VLLMLMTMAAQAAGLDLIEVGGAWGTPGATNPTAIWWNPAGLAVGGGTQFAIEGAPVFAKVYADRANPDYGSLEQTANGTDDVPDGYPTEYDYSGRDDVSLTAVVPFIGVSSDFGVEGLGIGAGLAVPQATGGAIEDEWGPNRYSLRSGNIQAVQAILAASYRVKKIVSFGVSGAFVDSTWSADTDTSTYVDLSDAVREEFGGLEQPLGSFRDGYMEQRGYTATAVFDDLKDQTFTFGAGVYVTPVEQVGISASFNKGMRLDHTGDVTLAFQCPPEYDTLVDIAAKDRGLCNGETGQGAVFNGTGQVGYNLPSRVNFGLVFFPVEQLRLEAMGSWVGWSAFTDYEITTTIEPDQVTLIQPDDPDDPEDVEEAQATREETASLASQDLLWARDGRDTFWAGIDAKHRVNEYFMYGGRFFYDRTSVPLESLQLNNFNGNTVGLMAMAMVSPIDKLGISVSFTHHFIGERTVENSPFRMTIYDDRAPERYQFPSANGTYGGSINRLGIALRGRFGHDRAKW